MRISALAQEILECTTYKVGVCSSTSGLSLVHCVQQIGTVEQVTERNEMHLSILKQQAEQEETMVREAKETSELMKKVSRNAFEYTGADE